MKKLLSLCSRGFWKLLGLIYVFPANVQEYLKIRVLKSHKKINRSSSNFPSSNIQIAILAIYPNPKNIWNAIKISKLLSKEKYDVLLISNTGLNSEDLLAFSGTCFQIIERENIGRDFGAYNHGLSWLREREIFPERILLLNDSVYYPTNFSEWIKRAKNKSGFGGLTINFQYLKHAQSFFLFADRTVIESRVWSSFWDKHIPLSSRIWNIEKGEYALNKAMRTGGFEPTALLEVQEFRDTLEQAVIEVKNEVESTARYRLLFSSLPASDGDSLVSKIENYLVDTERDSFEKGSLQISWKIPTIYQQQYLDKAEYYFTNTNPFWTTGMLLPALFDLPIKKDLMRRNGYQLSHILKTPGYSDLELEQMAASFLEKGTSADIHGIVKRKLFIQGRID